MMMLLAFVMIAGLMILVLRDRKTAVAAAPPATGSVISPTGSNELILDSEESAISFIRNELSRLGASDNDIDDYIDWIKDNTRSESEIRKRIESIIDQ